MEQISFYLDEHIHRAVADGLRHRGVNVLTVQEAGKKWRVRSRATRASQCPRDE